MPERATRFLAAGGAWARLRQPRGRVSQSALIGALALVLLTVCDLAAGGANVGVIGLGGVSVGVLAGIVLGLGVGLLLHVLSLLPVVARTLVWLLLGLGAAAWIANELGAWSAIGGRHDKLGWFALAASGALGLYVTALGCLLQPSRTRHAGWGAQLPRARRLALVLVLLLAAFAFGCIDRTAFPLTYPSAHLALRWAIVASVFSAGWIILAGVEPPPERARLVALGVGALTAMAAFVAYSSVNDDRNALGTLLRRPIARLAVRTLRTVTDVDADGYSALLLGGDCAPFDGAVNPGAEEIPGNGIDDNCVAGDATSGTRYRLEHLERPTEPSPISVVLITVDTLRADRMSLYGYERRTTPQIDQWARNGLRFDRAYSAAPWTTLSMSAFFRGVYPRRLKWTYVWETSQLRLLRWPFEDQLRPDETAGKVFSAPIEDEHRTLSEWLSWRGMKTSAVVDDGHSQFLEARLEIAGEFDHYRMARVRGKIRGDRSVTRLAKAQLGKLATGEPFFLWAHYFGPHDAPRGVKKPRFGPGRSDMYDHSIVDTDKQIGRLLEAVAAACDAHDRPIAVVLTADHGEEFLADHRGHGANLEDANVRVPLLIQGPGFAPGGTSAVASLVDVLPTVLKWTETPPPEGIDGRPLQEISAGGSPKGRVVLAETWLLNRAGKVYDDRVGAIGPDYKLEWILADQDPQLRRVGEDGVEGDGAAIDVVEVPHLTQAVEGYLEQNRRVDISR